MSNALMIPEVAPSYLSALLAANPALAAINQDALSGTAKPFPPSIVADKGRFIKKANGVEEPVVFPDNDANRAAGIVGMPAPQLQAVVLKAKPGKEKSWYAAKYMPGQETTSPDCQSEDGIKPTADSRLKQCESCAGCPQNVFGSGVDQSGNPTAGKSCKDTKVIALFAAGSVYRFAIPPASLKNWDSYCNNLSSKGIPLPAVITTIGFEQGDQSYKLVFNFGGMLAEEQVTKIVGMLDSAEVMEVVSPRTAQIAIAAPVAAPQITAPVAEVVKEAPAKPKAVEKAKPKAVEKAAPAAGMDLGLGLDTPAAPVAAQVQEAVVTAGPSDDALIAALNL